MMSARWVDGVLEAKANGFTFAFDQEDGCTLTGAPDGKTPSSFPDDDIREAAQAAAHAASQAARAENPSLWMKIGGSLGDEWGALRAWEMPY